MPLASPLYTQPIGGTYIFWRSVSCPSSVGMVPVNELEDSPLLKVREAVCGRSAGKKGNPRTPQPSARSSGRW